MTTAPIPQGYPAAQPFTPASYPGLAGKVVLNTGAGSGIGRAMAHAFARHGAKLMLLDIDTAGLEQTRAQLREAFPGVEVHIVQASIADDVAVEQACAVKGVHGMHGGKGAHAEVRGVAERQHAGLAAHQVEGTGE